MRWITLSMITIVGLVGCTSFSSLPLIYGETVRARYDRAEFGFGAARRDLWTQFRGDPFELGDEAFQAGMIDILARHPPKPQPTNFTTEPDESADTNYRAVFIFDPPAGFTNVQLCRLPLKLPKGPAETKPLDVAAAFCLQQGVLTAIRGRVDVEDGLDDPALDALMSDIIEGLFPNIGNNNDDEDGCFPPVVCR